MAVVGSRLESCGQTSAGTGPPPVTAPFSPASTRQPGNQELGGRQMVGQGATERDGSEGTLERFLASVPVSSGLLWGSHPSLSHGPPAEQSWSRVNWGSNPMLPGSAWPQPFPVRKPLVPSPWLQSWARWPPFPGLALSEQQGLDPFCPFCLLDLLFHAPTILPNPLHVPPTSLSCPRWSPPACPLGDAL